ncbi:GntR family transcriptional regulator [Eggerthella sp. YY7918]|uniref:GntR family transcriptional regulator n=1 Tax=Eggerthella sp. (strain YY7918) TaxID=502558 RepID=UPI0002170FC1|nr:GntR family transcriptional regulator [Eggerthella sp. YY7918]BAK43897.1 predicted transcriptional regulator [Eggerthella sp. YY7918]
MTITMIETIEKEATIDALGTFQVDEKSGVPIWIQIRKRLMFLISSGKFERGERLPSVRELSVRLGVNYNTINKVYQDLERDGYIFTKRGRGTYVSDLKTVDFSSIDGEVEALAVDFVQQALAKGMTDEDIHDMVSEQILLLSGDVRA